jgi:type IV secretion system protein VirB9
MRPLLAFVALAAVGPAMAGPTYPADPRIRTVDYVADAVITVPVSMGVVTRIVLQPGEKVVSAATGIAAKCDGDQNTWCVTADVGSDQIWIKPKTGARHNNLELQTDRRNYSFDLEVGPSTTYRVELRYPEAASTGQGPSEQSVVDKRLADAQPMARNLNYTLEGNGKGADITPTAVFDDGRFTYFRFPGNTEIPTIFVIGADGKEARTNYNMTGDDVVVQRLGRKFILRLGKSVVSVWNESFDARGIAPVDGTTVAGVARQTVGGANAN